MCIPSIAVPSLLLCYAISGGDDVPPSRVNSVLLCVCVCVLADVVRMLFSRPGSLADRSAARRHRQSFPIRLRRVHGSRCGLAPHALCKYCCNVPSLPCTLSPIAMLYCTLPMSSCLACPFSVQPVCVVDGPTTGLCILMMMHFVSESKV